MEKLGGWTARRRYWIKRRLTQHTKRSASLATTCWKRTRTNLSGCVRLRYSPFLVLYSYYINIFRERNLRSR